IIAIEHFHGRGSAACARVGIVAHRLISMQDFLLPSRQLTGVRSRVVAGSRDKVSQTLSCMLLGCSIRRKVVGMTCVPGKDVVDHRVIKGQVMNRPWINIWADRFEKTGETVLLRLRPENSMTCILSQIALLLQVRSPSQLPFIEPEYGFISSAQIE